MTKPIELYMWPTPNGHKITIALEEMELPYVIKPVNIGRGEQFTPSFMAISPNNRMPAIVDPEGPDGAPISVFESGSSCNISDAKAASSIRRKNARASLWTSG